VAEGSTLKEKIEMKSLLGLASYYRCFVKNFAQIIRLLIELLKGKKNSQSIQRNINSTKFAKPKKCHNFYFNIESY